MQRHRLIQYALVILVATSAWAEDGVTAQASADAAAEMAKKLQDPLASISAIMTDNDILFGSGNDNTSYSFQIQPVKSFDFPEQNFSFIARGVIPILGMAPGSQKPIIGNPLPSGGNMVWGLGDINTQFFVAPKSDSKWKWGVGPQISWRTRTDERLGGPGWGGGPVGVLVGSLSEDVSLSIIAGHLWGGDDGFSTTSIQPMLYYNFPTIAGAYVGYNIPITYAWHLDAGDKLTLPLGASVGRTFDIGNGYGLDLNIGAYYNAVRPIGAADWQLKWGVSLLMP